MGQLSSFISPGYAFYISLFRDFRHAELQKKENKKEDESVRRGSERTRGSGEACPCKFTYDLQYTIVPSPPSAVFGCPVLLFNDYFQYRLLSCGLALLHLYYCENT